MVVSVAGGAYGTKRAFDTLQQKRALKSWGLPPELLHLQRYLDALNISVTVNDIDWLRSARLRELRFTLNGSDVGGLRKLKQLTTLTLDLGPVITSLAWRHWSS